MELQALTIALVGKHPTGYAVLQVTNKGKVTVFKDELSMIEAQEVYSVESAKRFFSGEQVYDLSTSNRPKRTNRVASVDDSKSVAST